MLAFPTNGNTASFVAPREIRLPLSTFSVDGCGALSLPRLCIIYCNERGINRQCSLVLSSVRPSDSKLCWSFHRRVKDNMNSFIWQLKHGRRRYVGKKYGFMNRFMNRLFGFYLLLAVRHTCYFMRSVVF